MLHPQSKKLGLPGCSGWRHVFLQQPSLLVSRNDITFRFG